MVISLKALRYQAHALRNSILFYIELLLKQGITIINSANTELIRTSKHSKYQCSICKFKLESISIESYRKLSLLSLRLPLVEINRSPPLCH